MPLPPDYPEALKSVEQKIAEEIDATGHGIQIEQDLSPFGKVLTQQAKRIGHRTQKKEHLKSIRCELLDVAVSATQSRKPGHGAEDEKQQQRKEKGDRKRAYAQAARNRSVNEGHQQGNAKFGEQTDELGKRQDGLWEIDLASWLILGNKLYALKGSKEKNSIHPSAEHEQRIRWGIAALHKSQDKVSSELIRS